MYGRFRANWSTELLVYQPRVHWTSCILIPHFFGVCHFCRMLLRSLIVLITDLSLLQAVIAESGEAVRCSSLWCRHPLIFGQLLPYKETLRDLAKLLVEKIKSERSYSLTGSIIKTIFYALTSVYPSNRQSLNQEEWNHAGERRVPRR